MISITDFDESLEKMISKRFLVSGPKTFTTEDNLNRKIADISSSHKSCLIGKTSDPNSRTFHFYQEGYKYMFLVYESYSMETVDYYAGYFMDKYTYKFVNKFFGKDDVLNKNSYEKHYLFIATKGLK